MVEYQIGQVVNKTLIQNDFVSMTIFSFDKGEEISTHAAAGDAMVIVLRVQDVLLLVEQFLFLLKVKHL